MNVVIRWMAGNPGSLAVLDILDRLQRRLGTFCQSSAFIRPWFGKMSLVNSTSRRAPFLQFGWKWN